MSILPQKNGAPLFRDVKKESVPVSTKILVSTFTEKAAAELVSRISDRVAEEGLNVSLNEMFIGTMHSIFLRTLKDYAEFTRLRKNYKTLDETVAKIESYLFSNKDVKMCKTTCDNCDLRFFCHFK